MTPRHENYIKTSSVDQLKDHSSSSGIKIPQAIRPPKLDPSPAKIHSPATNTKAIPPKKKRAIHKRVVHDKIVPSVIHANKIKVIELFSGIGGGSAACGQIVSKNKLQKVYKTILASEIDKNARNIFHANFPDVPLNEDVTKLLLENTPKANLVIAGFPCQSFSKANSNPGTKGLSTENGQLFFQIPKVLKDSNADVVLLENVVTIEKYESVFIQELEKIGFVCTTAKLRSESFGVPQSRHRWYLVGVNKNSIYAKNIIDSEGNLAFNFPEDNIPKDSIRVLYDALEPIDKNCKYLKLASNYINEILCSHYKQLNEAVKNQDESDKYFLVGKTINPKKEKKTYPVYAMYNRKLGRSMAGPYTKQQNNEFPTKPSDINYQATTFKFLGSTAELGTIVSTNPAIGDIGRHLQLKELSNAQGFPQDFIFPKNAVAHQYEKCFANAFTVPVIRAIVKKIAEQIFGILVEMIVSEKIIPYRQQITWSNELGIQFKEAIVQEMKGFVPYEGLLNEACKEFSNQVQETTYSSLSELKNQKKACTLKRAECNNNLKAARAKVRSSLNEGQKPDYANYPTITNLVTCANDLDKELSALNEAKKNKLQEIHGRRYVKDSAFTSVSLFHCLWERTVSSQQDKTHHHSADLHFDYVKVPSKIQPPTKLQPPIKIMNDDGLKSNSQNNQRKRKRSCSLNVEMKADTPNFKKLKKINFIFDNALSENNQLISSSEENNLFPKLKKINFVL